MGINNNAKYYITTLIIFCILILTDWAFNILNNCYNVVYTFISFFLGGGIGILASYIVMKYFPDMQYYSISPTVCSYNYNNVYQCVNNSYSRQAIKEKKNETDEEKKLREKDKQSIKKEEEEEEKRKQKFEKKQLDLFIVIVIWFIIFSLVAYIVSIKK
jgi:ABC-type multidrug transport system fused ATPase/permease subunit